MIVIINEKGKLLSINFRFKLIHTVLNVSRYNSRNVLIPALSVEVCNCPDFRLSLSAVEGDTTKKLHRGFRYVAKKDSDVELK